MGRKIMQLCGTKKTPMRVCCGNGYVGEPHKCTGKWTKKALAKRKKR